jgi:hypothetical protein
MSKVEQYNEDLNDMINKVHEACEGRYNLDGYELHVIESALCELNDLKNLPNELRAVNRNEQLKEFFPVTCFRCGEKFNDITDAEGHRCVLRKNG